MLIEHETVRQVEGERTRRYFSDDDFDLIVWSEADGTIAGFQLCYDKERDERALTWKRGEGYSHERVDTGEVAGKAKTPVLVADGVFSASVIAERFNAASTAIDQAVFRFVCEKILSYSTSGSEER